MKLSHPYVIEFPRKADEAIAQMSSQEIERERMARECIAAHKRRTMEKRVENGIKWIGAAIVIALVSYFLAEAISR